MKHEIMELLRQRNHELIEANRQLFAAMNRLVKQADDLQRQAEERERYVTYLECIIHELGWNPTNE
jgi:hypothetical protein